MKARRCAFTCRAISGEAGALEEVAEAELLSSGNVQTVLIVEDEHTIRDLTAEVLEDAGYWTIAASDGTSGLRIFQSDTRIQLLVTDVGLPGGMSGRQLAYAARMGRPNLKMLFITGYAENAAVGNGLWAS